MPTLFHISDIHFGAQDTHALDRFAQAVADERPDAVICTGDITMRGTVREFDAAARWLSSLAAPVSVEPGNHDMPYYWEMWSRLRRPFARFQAARAASHRDLAVPGVAVVSLSTIVPAQWRLNWSKGCVTGAVLTRALHDLGAAQGLGCGLWRAITRWSMPIRMGRARRAGAGRLWRVWRRREPMRCSRAMCMTPLTWRSMQAVARSASSAREPCRNGPAPPPATTVWIGARRRGCRFVLSRWHDVFHVKQ
jgi:3',5'-cyclic AMP phosphodiesterase CpdA